MNEQGGLLACLVLHQVPMLCFPSMAAQVMQFIRRLKWECVPPILTKTLSVVWQTHCPCKKTYSSLQDKLPCQTVSLVTSFAARTLWGRELWTFLCPWSTCVHRGFFELLCALAAVGCNSRRACSCQEHVSSGTLLLVILAGVIQRGDFTLAGEGSFCWLVSTFVGIYQQCIET